MLLDPLPIDQPFENLVRQLTDAKNKGIDVTLNYDHLRCLVDNMDSFIKMQREARARLVVY